MTNTTSLTFYHYEYIDKEIYSSLIGDKYVAKLPQAVLDTVCELPNILQEFPDADLFRHRVLTNNKFRRFYDTFLKAMYYEAAIFNKDEVSQNTTALIIDMLVQYENPDYKRIIDLLKGLMHEKYFQYFYDEMVI